MTVYIAKSLEVSSLATPGVHVQTQSGGCVMNQGRSVSVVSNV